MTYTTPCVALSDHGCQVFRNFFALQENQGGVSVNAQKQIGYITNTTLLLAPVCHPRKFEWHPCLSKIWNPKYHVLHPGEHLFHTLMP